MNRDMFPDELSAAALAVKLLTEIQARMPEGFWFGGNLTLLGEAGTFGTFIPNDVETFNYLPNERVI